MDKTTIASLIGQLPSRISGGYKITHVKFWWEYENPFVDQLVYEDETDADITFEMNFSEPSPRVKIQGVDDIDEIETVADIHFISTILFKMGSEYIAEEFLRNKNKEKKENHDDEEKDKEKI